jgi:sec-independent protein translocase protein TatA
MFGLGSQELMVILAIAVLLFGAQKLPELARGLGQSMKEFKKGSIESDRDEPARPSPAPASGACVPCGKTLDVAWTHCPHCGHVVAAAEAKPPR